MTLETDKTFTTAAKNQRGQGYQGVKHRLHLNYSLWYVRNVLSADTDHVAVMNKAATKLTSNGFKVASASFLKSLSAKSGLLWVADPGMVEVFYNSKYIVIAGTSSTTYVNTSTLFTSVSYQVIRRSEVKKAACTTVAGKSVPLKACTDDHMIFGF